MTKVFNLSTDDDGIQARIRNSNQTGHVIVAMQDVNSLELIDGYVSTNELIDAVKEIMEDTEDFTKTHYFWATSPPSGRLEDTEKVARRLRASIEQLVGESVDLAYVQAMLEDALTPRPEGAEEIEGAVHSWSRSEFLGVGLDLDDISHLSDHIAREILRP